MTRPTIYVISVALVALSLLSCTNENNDYGSIDAGSMSGTIYKNNYFGFELKKPDQWIQLNSQQRRKLVNKEAKVVAGNNAEMEKHLDAAHSYKVYLFSWFQKSQSQQKGFSTNILGIAERITGSSGVKTSKDYLLSIKSLMMQSAVNYQTAKKIQGISLNGEPFKMLEVQATLAGQIIKQRYYTRISKSYALTFILSWQTEGQLKIITQTLLNIKFIHKHDSI